MTDLRSHSQHLQFNPHFHQPFSKSNILFQQQQHHEERGRSKSKGGAGKEDHSRGDSIGLRRSSTTDNTTRHDTSSFQPLAPQSRKNLVRTHQDLLQHAITHQRQRTNTGLPRSVSVHGIPHIDHHNHLHNHHQKNIRMVPNDSISNNKKETATSHEAKPRPKFRKWNSFQMPTDLQTPSPSDEKSENFKNSGLIAPYNHSGASPLSALKDEYNTRRPVVNTAMDMKTDNLFDSLMAKNSSTPEVKQKPSSIYQKMLHLAQSGVDSLKSLTETAGGAAANSSTNSPASNTNGNGNDEDNDDNDNGDDVDVDVDVELSSDDNEPSTSTILGGTPVKKSNEDDTQYPVDQLEDGINNEKLPEMQDLIKEIMDFKHDLGDKLEAKDPQKLTRTQQKLMDYKELHDFEAENPRPENMSSYKWKIQNETILSQYNNIRLRFSSREKPNSKKKKIENLSGVLGFVKRYGGNDDHHIDGINSGGPTIPTLATESKERKSMLQSMWDDEYSKNFVTTPLTDDS